MRKAKPILAVLSVQLLIAVLLTLVNPVGEYIVRTKGTEYTFATEAVEIYGDYEDYVEIQCPIKHSFDKNQAYDYYDRQYAIIEADENGLSYIAALSDNPPESGVWLGTEKDSFHQFNRYYKRIDYNLYKKAEESADFFDTKVSGFSDEYETTVSVYVYKGKAVLNEIRVNGVEIQEFFKSLGK